MLLMAHKLFGPTQPPILSKIIATYALFQSPEKQSMFLSFIKHSLAAIKADYDKSGNLDGLETKVKGMHYTVTVFLAKLSQGKTNEEIVDLIRNTSLDQLNLIFACLQPMARNRTESTAFEKWSQFFGISEASWQLYKARDQSRTSLGQFLFSSQIRTQLAKLSYEQIASMLVQLLCKRLLFVGNGLLSLSDITFDQLPSLVNAYKDSKEFKCLSYHNACWEDLPKNFDRENIQTIFYKLLKGNKAEMLAYIKD